MASRIQNGLLLMRYTFNVLKSDKRLFAFPIISMLACLVIFIFSSIIGVANYFTSAAVATPNHSHHIMGYLGLFIAYFALYFTVIFFNTALAINVIEYAHGKGVSVRYSLARAWDNIELIVRWALVSATIGLILHHITNQSHRLGRIVASILGVTWNTITYFVIPTLVVEHLGPISAIKRSMSLIKKTWGESLTSVLGLGIVIFISFLLCLIPVVLGIYLKTGSSALIGFLITLFLVILLFIFNVTLTMILRCTLYLYATENLAPTGIDPLLLQSIFSK